MLFSAVVVGALRVNTFNPLMSNGLFVPIKWMGPFVVVVVALLFYVHGKHLRSRRDGQLTYPHFFWAGLDLLSG